MAGTNRNSGSKRGFAAMDSEVQRKIASKGGRASHGGRNNDTSGSDRANGGSSSSSDNS